MNTGVLEQHKQNRQITLPLYDSGKYSVMVYEIFILSLILTWFPSKLLPYASPYIIIFYTIIVYQHYSIFFNFIKVLSLIFLFIAVNYLIRGNYIFSNGVLTLITYGPFLLLWAMPNKGVSPVYMKKIYRALYFTVGFQSVVGVAQFLIALVKQRSYSVDMGDFIQGTIVPLSFNLEGDRGIGNAYFVINILIMMLFIIVDDSRKKKKYFILSLASLTVILAGVHHALISIFMALFLSLFIVEVKKAIRYIYVLLPAIVFALAIFYFLNPNNVYLYSHYFDLYSSGESFKTIAMKNAIIDLYNDHPYISIFGTGLGQFSSRAGLIASGTYLGGLDENRSIPFFSIAKSEYFKHYAFEVYYAMKMDKSTVHGAASRPFFSLMSLYVELGMIAFFAIVFYISVKIYQIKSRYALFNKIGFVKAKNTSTMLISCILFFAFVSFFENYLEMSQSTLTCFIIAKIFYNNLFESVQFNSRG